MAPRWERLAGLNLNTVLVPVSWELIEPDEGRFDFALVDGLLDDARAQHLRVVLLWFGRSEEHTSELQSLMRISYAVFCLKKKKHKLQNKSNDIRIHQ